MLRIFSLLIFLLSYTVNAQKIDIVLGPSDVAENQFWTITVSVSNDNFKNYDAFPDVEGFRKRGTSTQSQTSIVNGQMSTVQSVIMTYQPVKQGTFVLPPFKMKINGQVVSSPGKTIRVGQAVQSQARDPFNSLLDRDPFADMFSKRETEFVEVKEDAFLAVTTDKDEVYTGEGFTATLSFYISETNRATMQFFELGEQLTGILKQLRPDACWEENFNIENIEGERIEIGGKGYTQYKIYQAAFYPLNAKNITFPSVGLKMIKFKVAKNPSFFGQNRQEDFKTFYTKAKTVRVKELPPHPLRESVAVGAYRVEEKISEPETTTGKSVGFDFTILGEGNISGIQKPLVSANPGLEFFDPNIRQSISRNYGRVAGSKTFSYFIIPNEAGEYDLGQHIQLIYFDPARKQYDTLKPRTVLRATGENRQNIAIESKDATSFYDRISSADNTLKNQNAFDFARLGANLFVAAALGAAFFLIIRKQKQ
ncbi:MAG: BatD family protein [Bacteroidetes bacterium]|nr:BatD family protein [Bacteroidota bacterium]